MSVELIPDEHQKEFFFDNGMRLCAIKDYFHAGSPSPILNIYHGSFNLCIANRKQLERLKDLVDFALEIVTAEEIEERF